MFINSLSVTHWVESRNHVTVRQTCRLVKTSFPLNLYPKVNLVDSECQQSSFPLLDPMPTSKLSRNSCRLATSRRCCCPCSRISSSRLSVSLARSLGRCFKRYMWEKHELYRKGTQNDREVFLWKVALSLGSFSFVCRGILTCVHGVHGGVAKPTHDVPVLTYRSCKRCCTVASGT